MRFIIKCSVFSRLADVVSFFEPETPEEIKDMLSCVRLENFNKQTFAIVSNQKIASVECLGPTNEPNGIAHVVIDPALVEKCREEGAWNSMLEIITIPEVAIATAKTLGGYTFPGNACIWPSKTCMDEWWEWAPDKVATKTNGPMLLNLDQMNTLVKSSPSGRVVFPEFIDNEIPAVLRDYNDPNWVGLIMVDQEPGEPDAKPAVLPTWWA